MKILTDPEAESQQNRLYKRGGSKRGQFGRKEKKRQREKKKAVHALDQLPTVQGSQVTHVPEPRAAGNMTNLKLQG